MKKEAQIFDIISREKSTPFGVAVVEDFNLTEKGFINAQEILENPNILLYSLDPQNQQAVFVEVQDVANVLKAPFYYLAQYEEAIKVLKISYDIMAQLADQVTLDEQRLVLIYSIGRCGSTLVSSAFNQLQDVVSIAEPDVFTQLVQMFDFSGSNKQEISELVKSCLLLTCKHPGKDQQPVWVIKFRSFVLELADIIHAHFPQAKNLFLYRHAESWGHSTARAFGGDTMPSHEQLIGFWMWLKQVVMRLDQYPLSSTADINISLLVILMWLGYLERCLGLIETGQPLLPVRYEDLKTNPEAVMERIFAYCGVAGLRMNDAIDVFSQDSQAGTPISRDELSQVDWVLDSETIALIRRIIAEQPVINTPDYQLPGTLQL